MWQPWFMWTGQPWPLGGQLPTSARSRQHGVLDPRWPAFVIGKRPAATGRTDQRTDVVRVGTQEKHLMRLLLLRVPAEVAERRRASLKSDALRLQHTLRQTASCLPDLT